MSHDPMMLILLREKLLEVIKAVLPLVVAIVLLQFTVVHAPVDLFFQFLAGSLLAIIGMLLIFVGVDLGILPIGRFIGAELPKRGSIARIVILSFALVFAMSIAEPDVLVLSRQVDIIAGGAVSGQGLLFIIAFGVAAFAALAIARIILGWSMRLLLTIAYGVVVLLALAAPTGIVPLAFDAGSVTTGILSAPVIIALALGLSGVLAERSSISDGFGLLGLASIGPVIVILLLGMVVS